MTMPPAPSEPASAKPALTPGERDRMKYGAAQQYQSRLNARLAELALARRASDESR